MAHYPLTSSVIILDKYDLSSDMNAVNIQRLAEGLNNTCFGNTFMARLPGLSDGVFGLAGLLDLTDDGIEEILNAKISLSNQPILVGLGGAADFARVKFGKIQQGQLQVGGPVGTLAEWSAEGRISSSVLTDGNIMAVGAKTGTFNGTWRELGASSATQRTYATLHATAKNTFTSAVFKLQSADDGIGTNAQDRIVFTTVTDLTSEFASVSGPVTQTFWRIMCSAFTGTSLTIYAAAGIQ